MAINTNNQHITPEELTQEQDMLLLAGSKVSLRDITQKEMDLPLSKNGKYYSANDVDNLFVLINGILTSVSEQAFRTDKALTEARKSIAENDEQQNTLTQQINNLQDQVNKLSIENQLLKQEPDNSDEIDTLKNKLEVKESEYSRLLETSSSKMSEQTNKIDKLEQENDELKTQVASLTNELQDLIEQQNNQSFEPDTGLQSDYDMLKYKYENLKTLSSQRIQDLTNKIKGEI